MTTVSIRQPGYLPYIGFFKKIESCDVFVFLDDVQYVRGEWENRNKIRTSEETIWLTVPILNKFGEQLNEVKIDNSKNWSKKHITSIQINYNKSKYFLKYFKKIEFILEKKWTKLIDLNLCLIDFFLKELEINTKCILSSDLHIESKKSLRLLEICKKLNASTYVSGKLGADYLDENIFKNNGISIIFEDFKHPIYKQTYDNFIPNVSVIDLLFNEGENAKKIIHDSKNI